MLMDVFPYCFMFKKFRWKKISIQKNLHSTRQSYCLPLPKISKCLTCKSAIFVKFKSEMNHRRISCRANTTCWSLILKHSSRTCWWDYLLEKHGTQKPAYVISCRDELRGWDSGPLLTGSQPHRRMMGGKKEAVNTLRQRQNGRYFADYTLKRIFLNENCCILIKISLKFVPQGPINNIPALV